MEMMDWRIFRQVLDAARRVNPKLIDITGGAPELNPHLREFVSAIKREGCSVQIRTNMTVLLEQGMEEITEFYRDCGLKLLASMPCYLKKEVDSQRGKGVFEKSIEALRLLNSVGYGSDPKLKLDLVFKPEGAFLPPKQSLLEVDFRRELYTNYGIVFNGLLTITNMPIGRFLQMLHQRRLTLRYTRLLKESFNPRTIDKLMCRHQISIDWKGVIYDCDFNLALGLPVKCSGPPHIKHLTRRLYSRREVVTGDHCFGCTAGQGSSCGGALMT